MGLTVVNHLYVCRHGEHFVGAPVLSKGVEVGSLIVHAIESHQAHHRKHYALMTKTQGCAVFTTGYSRIGGIDKVPQQVAVS